MNGNNLIVVEDVLYPSDNLYDIPSLRLDRQAGMLKLPLSPLWTWPKNERGIDDSFLCR